MDWTTLLIGIGAELYGITTIILRVKAPEKLGKYEPMKQRFGAPLGTAIHVFAYSIVPLVFGGMAIFLGLQGRSIF